MTRVARAILMAVLPWSIARGQDSTRASCPVVNGLFVSMSTGDSGATPHANRQAPRELRVDGGSIIDTVWTFNIAERHWTRPYFAAAVGAGWSDAPRASGMTTAPGSSAAPRWSACAGAAIGMRDPTLVLRGARGRVHLRADVRALSRGRGSMTDTTSQPRR